MSHYYDPATLQLLGPVATKDGWREPTLRDARKVNAVPSVTTVLQLLRQIGLDKWKMERIAKAAYEIGRRGEPFDFSILWGIAMEPADTAADFGTEVHAGISCWLNNLEFHTSNIPVLRVVNEFVTWAKSRRGAVRLQDQITFSVSEKVFVNSEWGVAGTADLLGTYAGDDAIFDIKTQEWGKGEKPNFYHEWALQLSGYVLGLGLPQETRRLSIVLNRSTPGDIIVREWPDVARWDQAWRSVLRSWQLINNYYPGQSGAADE